MTTRLAITPGDPAGIGPDIVIQLAQQSLPAQLVVFADPGLLAARACQLRLPLHVLPFQPGETPAPTPAGALYVSAVPLLCPVIAGQGSKDNAPHVLACLDAAVASCLAGICDGLVTGPVNKGLINLAGIPFSGHTEYLAGKTGSPHVVMMLTAPGLRVALATTHLPLRKVPDAITSDSLESTIRVLNADLRRYFCTRAPRILVCGLNPHAGDQGALGREEIDIIQPLLARLQHDGLDVSGPWPADTVFSPDNISSADAFLAMYHDQGLPVLKSRGFGSAVNITLGLRLVRTSVDHGTAFSLAGTGKADPHSLQLAIETAIAMCLHRT